MNADIHQRLGLIHESEKQYYSSLHKTELIYRDEEARLLQLRNLAIRDDAAHVNDQLILQDRRTEGLSRQNDKLRLELESQASVGRSKEAQLIKQTLDLAALRAEMDSLNTALSDSNKVVEEKFVLTRELNRLRPEVQHLQSQLADYKHVAAQKNDLQRRLDSLEMEFRDEKDRKQQNFDREVDALVSELRQKVKEAEQRAAIETKERERSRLEHEQRLSQSHGLTDAMKGEVMSLKAKLKEVQQELKETKVELEHCRSDLQAARATTDQSQEQRRNPPTIQPPNPKQLGPKKAKVEFARQTPGRSESTKKPMMKKRPLEQALLGGKSDFSVTPFLSRTKSLLDDANDDDAPHVENAEPGSSRHESPSPEQTKDGVTGAVTVEDPPASHDLATAAKPQKRGRPKTTHATKLPSIAKTKSAPSTKKVAIQELRTLEDVAEEPCPEEQRSDGATAASQARPPQIVAKENPFTINAKKRRKLLGGVNKSLFEDEAEESVPQSTKNPLGHSRKLKAPLKGAISAFGTSGVFSPLKRDRRGVNASFLA